MMPVPPSVITNPPRQWDRSTRADDLSRSRHGGGRSRVQRSAGRPDLDPSLWTGSRWAEGPAWSGQGQYLVFSDVQTNTQYRYSWETGEVSAFRKPSHNSNGNSFDFQGRQLSTQDFFRRVVRWEHDGSMTVIADSFEGQPLNSPNDLAPHPDGSIWFTDPPYGARLSEGHPDFAGGPTNPDGRLNPLIGQPDAGAMGGKRRALPTNTYRWDPSGRLELVLTGEQVPDPNGLCFSPDYKVLYVVSTGKGPGDKVGGGNVIYAFDVEGGKLTNQRLFSDMIVDGVTCGPDGLRADVYGNLWSGSNAPLGYAGVTVWNPQGKLLGQIRLPEVCANVAFGGPKRDHLFMTASQSLYVLQVQTQAPGLSPVPTAGADSPARRSRLRRVVARRAWARLRLGCRAKETLALKAGRPPRRARSRWRMSGWIAEIVSRMSVMRELPTDAKWFGGLNCRVNQTSVTSRGDNDKTQAGFAADLRQ